MIDETRQDEAKPSAAETLFPLGTEYVLHSGEKVSVRRWSIETLCLMSQRIPTSLEFALQGENENTKLISLMPRAIEELVFMIAETLGWTEDEVRSKMDADDLLGVATVVFDVCVIGPMGKLEGLWVRILAMLKQTPTQPSSPPSTS